MAYYSRKDLLEDGCFFHITWRCHNKRFLLGNEFAKKNYYDLLVKYKGDYGVSFFSYCFMSNHVHLLGRCETVNRLSGLMRKTNSLLARVINKRANDCGQVIMDRFKSSMIETDYSLSVVSNYVELNAFRAKIVKHPKFYKWCSYNYYAFGKNDPLITTSPAYINFGNSDEERKVNYISMIDEIVEAELGLSKQDFSSSYYIGEPAWVLEKVKSLKEKRKLGFKKKQNSNLARDDVLTIT